MAIPDNSAAGVSDFITFGGSVTIEDTDDDRSTAGRNLRDDDDDGDGDADDIDCNPIDPNKFSEDGTYQLDETDRERQFDSGVQNNHHTQQTIFV